MISDEQIIQFKKLYKAYFDEEITTEEVLDKAEDLIRLVELIYNPENLINFENNKNE